MSPSAACDLGLHCCPSPGFTDNTLYTALCPHSDKNMATMIKLTGFRLTLSLSTVVNDYHVANYLKEILA